MQSCRFFEGKFCVRLQGSSVNHARVSDCYLCAQFALTSKMTIFIMSPGDRCISRSVHIRSYEYCHVYEMTIDGFGLIIGFIEHLQIQVTITDYGSLQSAIYHGTHKGLSVCCLRQCSLVTASNCRRSPSPGFPNRPRASATSLLD
jgi:hypothetical protein